MKIIITESQIALLRRLTELEQILDTSIKELNKDIMNSGPGNKPDNFGVYENWVSQRVSDIFKRRHPNIDYKRLDFLILYEGLYLIAALKIDQLFLY